jgi:hypothetical protein
MASIASALSRIKQLPLEVFNRNAVEKLCRQMGHQWRGRELDPATTLALFIQQVIHGNTPCSEVRHIAGRSFTASAYCQARERLPLGVCQAMLTAVIDKALPLLDRQEHRWHGHRTFHIDGSTFSMPDTPQLRRAFGTPCNQSGSCGFPTAHLLVLFSASTGILLDAWASPLRTGDQQHTREAHLHLSSSDLVIGDDSFSGYAHLAMLKQADLHGLFPVHHLRIVDFAKNRPYASTRKNAAGMPTSRWIKSLGKEDQLVEYFKLDARPRWMSPQQFDDLPDSIVVREIRRTVRRPGLGKVTLTMVSTLLDAQAYPADELLQLRLRRWDVETNLAYLKTMMRMDVLRCKSEQGVRKELAVFCLIYNLVRLLMLEAARRQQAPVARVSFSDALKWIRHARPGEALRELIINPRRPNRLEPRCRKRRPRQYDLMNKPRDVLRKLLKNKHKND